MRKQRAIPTITLFAVLLGLFTPEYAQNMPTRSGETEHARRSVAIKLLRGINTAEMNYRQKHGVYVSWDVLVKTEEFTDRGMKWAAGNEPQLANIHFADAPEILPGWRLRLNVTADGKGYDLLLEDETDKTCGYAAITDERGLIRQSKVIDCQI
jgi:hypothetical protein